MGQFSRDLMVIAFLGGHIAFHPVQCVRPIYQSSSLSRLELSRIRVAVGGVDVAKRRKVKGRREREGECKCTCVCVALLRGRERERDDSGDETEKERPGEAAKRGGVMSTAQLPEIPPQRSTAVRSVVVPCQTADGKWPRCGRGVELLQAAPPFIQDACPGSCP